MAILQLEERQPDKPVVTQALRELAASGLAPRRARIARGIPLYGVDDLAEDARSGRPFLRGRRYLVFDEEGRPIMTVDVEETDNGTDVGVVRTGETVSRLVVALGRAEAAAHGDAIEIRLIEVPAAGAQAVWLHGAEERFLKVDDSAQVEPGPLQAFLHKVGETLAARLQAASQWNEEGE